MSILRTVRQSIPLTASELWLETRVDQREVSANTIYKAEKGEPISRSKAFAIIHTLNRVTGQNYTRKSFPDLKIIEELEEGGEIVEEEPDRAIA